MERTRRIRPGWLLFAAATVVALVGLVGQRVDPSNRALKLPDGADARAMRELAGIVPDDPVVLIGCATTDGSAMSPELRAAVEGAAEAVRGMPSVARCDVVELPEQDLVLLPVALATVGDAVDPAERAAAVIGAVGGLVPPTLEVLATGLPLIEGRIAALVAGERTSIVPALLAVLLCAAWLAYRRLLLAVAVVLPAVTAIAWLGGALAWLGHELDPVAALLDPVLLTIGVAASVHFVEAFRAARAGGASAVDAAAEAGERVRRPAFWATTTTMLGVWSLTLNETPAVVDFGVRAAFGVALTHLFTFVLLPRWLPWVARRDGAVGARPPAAPGARWVEVLRRARPLTIAVTAAGVALAAAGLSGLRTENDPLTMLPRDEVVRADHDRLAARLGGVETLHLLIAEGSGATEANRLLPFLAGVRDGDVLAGLAGPVLRGVEGDLAVPLLMRPSGSAARVRCFDELVDAAHLLGLGDVRPVGPSVQIARDSELLIRGLLGSLAVSLVVLTVVMAIGLGSMRLAALAMCTNMLPSLWLYGGLGASDRPLSVATAMIGCTMLGLIVDNTLHLLHRYREARRERSAQAALVAALDHCGRAVTVSSLVLVLGFATAGLSRLSTTVEFSLLATATIVMAWFGTAVLLPTMLLVRGEPAAAGGTP